MNFIRNRNFRAGPQTSLEGFICPQNSDKQQKIKVFGRSAGGGKINNLILSFGQHTLYIYILHFYLIRGNLSLPVSAHIILFSAPFYYLTIYSVFSIVIMWICVQVADFLNTNKYIRMYVFGSRK